MKVAVIAPVTLATLALVACVPPPQYVNVGDVLAHGPAAVSPYRQVKLHLTSSENFNRSIKFMRDLSALGIPDRSPAFAEEIKSVFRERFSVIGGGAAADLEAVVDAIIEPGQIFGETTIRLAVVIRDTAGRQIATVSSEAKGTRPYIGGANHPEIDGLAGYGPNTLAAAAEQLGKSIDNSVPLLDFARSYPRGATVASPAPSSFPTRPLALSFAKSAERAEDVAVIIGNADYAKLGKDIPDVTPAYADAGGMKRYAIEALGIREGNVIFVKDATSAQIVRVFGSATNPRGQLFDWVKPGKSRVFVYYAGHGAPAVQGGSPYLVPADADAARIELNGYPLATLYANLARLPAESVTVVLEACFSGASQAGSVITQASPVFARVQAPSVPARLTVLAAGAANQIASWEQDSSHGLFTKYFLLGQSGEADKAPHGNGDGRVALDEIDRYLKDTLTYYARRYYGRDQTAQIVRGTP